MARYVLVEERGGLSQAHKLAIGEVVTAWAHLEDTTRDVLNRLLGAADQKIAQVVVHTLWQHRIVSQVLATIAPFALDGEQGPQTVALRAILDEVGRLATERDRVAHSVWWRASGNQPSRTKPKRGKAEAERATGITADSIGQLAQRIRDIEDRLMEWTIDSGIWPDASTQDFDRNLEVRPKPSKDA